MGALHHVGRVPFSVFIAVTVVLSAGVERARAQETISLELRNTLDKTVTVTITAKHPYQPGSFQRVRLSPKGTRGGTDRADLRSPDPFFILVEDQRGNAGRSQELDLKKWAQENPNTALMIVPTYAGPINGLMAAWSFRSPTDEDADSISSGSLEPVRRR